MSAPLADQDRHRSLADLEAAIAKAEGTCAKYRADLEACVASGRDTRHPAAMLRLAEDRAAQLRAGRDVLAHGDLGAAGDDQGEG